jgi:hypothetical protein
MILLFFGFMDDAAQAQSGVPLKLDPARISWNDLKFHAKNFWVEVTTKVQLRPLAASELDNFLPAPPRGNPIKPLTSEITDMTIQTTIDPSSGKCQFYRKTPTGRNPQSRKAQCNQNCH